MKFIFIKLIQLYQFIISPLLPSSCRYEPTCSQYMIDAVKAKSLPWGICLGIWRILRCHPFGGSGYDPVKQPEEEQEKYFFKS
ncbi:MAG: membrane protein insertion efficiency factor YidD [Candidatus Loosdrechtia sp.]|uniref:membrane protein insertion efficiency factor YidD n=1 Tax=Candidatus Loosdrechtia sp. TaxID=3101272 RepID=UPI003A6A9DB3|nr:MAG: membrane protein insertion efficiency factor YidD [Candidatus Jettenia sp. AMX2]